MKSLGIIQHLFFYFFSETSTAARGTYNATKDNSNRDLPAEVWIALAKASIILSCILSFVGVEAFKIIFRRNFGSKGINKLNFWICIICFLVAGTVALINSLMFLNIIQGEKNFNKSPFHPIGAFVATLFYFILVVYMMFRYNEHKKIVEINHLKNTLDDSAYEGSSYMLKGLIDAGWKEKNVKNFAEPILAIAIGIFLFGLLGYFSLPILFCSISLWIYQITALRFGYNPTQATINKQGYGAGSKEFFYANN